MRQWWSASHQLLQQIVSRAPVVEYIVPAPVVIGATASASHDGPDAVALESCSRARTTEAAYGRDPATAADAAADATADAAADATAARAAATPSVGNERQSQQLILKGFNDIETFSGGEEQWQNWSRKFKTAVSGMSGELVEMLITAEANGVESTEEMLRENRFVDGNRERRMKASRKMYTVLARYTGSEASTSVKSVTELE